jgi:hypothetical protein
MAVQPAKQMASSSIGSNPSLSPPVSGSPPSGTVYPLAPVLVKESLFIQVTFASMIIAPKVELHISQALHD